MEKRAFPRTQAAQTAKLTVLEQPSYTLTAEVLNLSGRGAGLRVEQQIPTGTPVRLDLKDSLFLGEVCRCASTEGGFLVGLQLEQALTDVASLDRLVNRLLVFDRRSREKESASDPGPVGPRAA